MEEAAFEQKKGRDGGRRKQACEDGDQRRWGGRGALSVSAGAGEAACPWPLLPPLCGGDHGWQSLASRCPRRPRTPTSPHPGLRRAPTAGTGDTHGTACRWDAAASAAAQGLPPAPNWPQQEGTPLHVPRLTQRPVPPARVAPTSSPGTVRLLLRAPAPHPGMTKAKKAQAEGRRWLRGLEGDGPSAMSPPCASPGYLHVERERPSSVQAEGAAVRVAGHRKAILRPPARAHQISP